MEQENASSNRDLWERSSKVLPGGVCSSARFHSPLGYPFYISKAAGSKVFDLDGKDYVDLTLSFGATLVGHAHPNVVEGIKTALEMGIMCSYENEWQQRLAQRLSQIVPCIDMIRFTLTGTESTYYAVKLAREYTGRTTVVKFEGHFHGFNDYLAYNYWPSREDMWPKTTPAVAALPEYLKQGFRILPFNDRERLERMFETEGDEIAAVILEPVNYNSGTIMPETGYLQYLRDLTARHDALLIFDEVLSGFRTGPGCMQEAFGVTPDLCILGKAIGGGTCLSAFGGTREVMEHVAPLGNAQHSGTYNGHIIEMMAANSFLDLILADGFYEDFIDRCNRFYEEVNGIFRRQRVAARAQGYGARFSLLFGPPSTRSLRNYADVVDNDMDVMQRFSRACLEHGVFLHPMRHHGLSSAHSDADITRTLEAIEKATREIKPHMERT